MVILYQEKTDGEDGFYLQKNKIGLSVADQDWQVDLDQADQNVALESLLRSFRVLDYFPEQEFSMTNPLAVNLAISIDYSLGDAVSGICDIDSPDYMRSSNIWEAEWSQSNLFAAAEHIDPGARTYLPLDQDCSKEGWVFQAPFLYSGVFASDHVLRKRMLLAIEAVLYRIENKTISYLPHRLVVNNVFSAADRPWQFNIPVLSA